VILVAFLVQVVGLVATSVFTYVSHRAIGLPAWLATPAVTVLGGVVVAVVQAVAEPARPERVTRARGPRGQGALGVVIVLLVLVLGGVGVAVGVRYAVGWVTGNEDQVGRERLASAAPADSSGRVTVTVTGVVNTAHFTRVRLTVVNGEKQSATLSLYRNCVLTAGGVTLQADPFKSRWPEEVPPDSSQQGQVIFPGHLPADAATGQLSFLHVFVFGRFGADDSIVIRPIRLRGP